MIKQIARIKAEINLKHELKFIHQKNKNRSKSKTDLRRMVAIYVESTLYVCFC